MRYAVIGTGAIGGFYGAKLQRSGLEVHFLLNKDYAHVQRHGLKIYSKDGDFCLPAVHAHASPATIPVCDVVLIALKTTQNDLLKDLLPPWVADQGILLTLQNGLGIEPQLAQLVNQSRVILGGLCFICSHRGAPGEIHHQDYGSLTIGAYGDGYEPQGVTPLLETMADHWRQAGVETAVTPDLGYARWKKLLWNVPFNSLSVVLSATTTEMMANPQTHALARDLMEEVQQAAASQGVAIPTADLEQMLRSTATMAPYVTSMKRDYDHKMPLELEAILGYPLAVARRKGLALPRMTMLVQLLQHLDQHNRGLSRWQWASASPSRTPGHSPSTPVAPGAA